MRVKHFTIRAQADAILTFFLMFSFCLFIFHYFLRDVLFIYYDKLINDAYVFGK